MQLILGIPLHERQMGHVQHVAVSVVAVPVGAVGLNGLPKGCAAQAVADLAGL